MKRAAGKKIASLLPNEKGEQDCQELWKGQNCIYTLGKEG